MKNLKKSLKNKSRLLFFAGSLLLFVTIIFALASGSTGISFVKLWNAVLNPGETGTYGIILRYIRIPRVVASLLSGAALAVSGCVLQSVLSNKLASPGIIGVNAGAGLGVTLCAFFGVVSGIAFSVSAFLGAGIASVVIMIAAFGTRASKTMVILGGVAVNSILNAVTESLSVLNLDAALTSADFRVGGFSAVSQTRLFPAAVIIAFAFIILLTLCNELDVLSLGDETAGGLGMNVKRMRIVFLILASLLSGASVSFAGLLGFVGLIVPNLIRGMVGDKSSLLLPLSAIYGAFFVTLSDTVARVAFSPYEIPVGIIMALVGGPVFIALLIKSRGGRKNA